MQFSVVKCVARPDWMRKKKKNKRTGCDGASARYSALTTRTDNNNNQPTHIHTDKQQNFNRCKSDELQFIHVFKWKPIAKLVSHEADGLIFIAFATYHSIFMCIHIGWLVGRWCCYSSATTHTLHIGPSANYYYYSLCLCVCYKMYTCNYMERKMQIFWFMKTDQ